MTILNIVPECFADTRIIEILGQIKKCNHQHGSGDVANVLKNKLENNIAMGVIDEDINKGPRPKYFSEFNVVREENSLILKRHINKKQYLVLVCPEIEKWLMNDSRVVNIDPADDQYNLPTDLKGFLQKTKQQNIDKNQGFNRFIKDLVKANSPSITTLKRWIELFKSDQMDNLIL